jgi:putative ABC transport system permease protein
VDYFTEIQVTIPGNYAIYTDEYHDALDAAAEELKPLVEPLAQQRFEKLKKEAQKEYDDGLKEYQDGLKEYQDGKKKAEKELADAKKELENAEAEIESNRTLIEDGMLQMKDAQELLAQNAVTLAQSK